MTVAELAIPQGWDAISAEWMTAVLADHFPGVQVDDVAFVLRDDGTNRRARLQLTYSAGAGPATVFAKAVDPEHADLVALTSGLYHEPRLFSSGVVLPLDHPMVYTAIIDEERRDFLMSQTTRTNNAAVVARVRSSRPASRASSASSSRSRWSRTSRRASRAIGCSTPAPWRRRARIARPVGPTGRHGRSGAARRGMSGVPGQFQPSNVARYALWMIARH